ncbi:MAG: HAMP domain-containing histidine kinase [Chrysiogenetes bacterium]|nr:HAMP domain-containing histidine kinase [Candidatus Dadabacteria bacterium]MCB0218096.1 HAMP domain-containing histidine kinase [Chrysiogenetes bacterium]
MAEGGNSRWPAGKVGNPLEWSDPLRCLVVALITIPYPFLNAAELGAVGAEPSRAPFIDPAAIPMFVQSQLYSGYLWLVLIVVCLVALWRGVKESRALVLVTALLFGSGQGVLIYFLGTLTTPAMVTFLGSTLAAAVWLGVGAAVLGMGSGAIILIGTTIAENAGAIPYGPLVRAAPFADGQLHPWWLRIVGLTSVGYTVGTLAMIGLVLYLWKKRERELADANAALLRNAETKDRFVATVSHELRTPLTSILGSLRLMQMKHDRGESEDDAEILSIAARGTDRLVRLVGDLLDIRTLESGHLTRALVPTDLVALTRQVRDELRPLAQSCGVEVELTVVPGAEGNYLADPDRLMQVLWNLLDNAIKYSPEGGRVGVALYALPRGGVALRVEDQGPGIPPGAGEEIFEPFYRAGELSTNPGSGLGLSIVKTIAEAHGGRVRAENRPEGGARFVVELPLKHAD